MAAASSATVSEALASGPALATAESKAPRKLKYFMDGAWHESKTSQYLPVTNSSTGKVMAEAPSCTLEEVNAAVECADAAFPAWRDTPITQRVQVMFRYKGILEQHIEELAVLLSTEMGKTLAEARGDVIKAIEVVELACAVPVTMQGRSMMNVSTGYDTVSYREPLGVFVGIAPFNFPAMIPLGWMIPLAITTGNTFVLKAASYVPQTAMRMTELLMEAGLPRGVVNLVTASRHESEPLLKHPKVKGVTFVGSKKVGLHVYKTAAAEGKRVQALTEAKNHALVLRDAPIMATASASSTRRLAVRASAAWRFRPSVSRRRLPMSWWRPSSSLQSNGKWDPPGNPPRSWAPWSRTSFASRCAAGSTRVSRKEPAWYSTAGTRPCRATRAASSWGRWSSTMSRLT